MVLSVEAHGNPGFRHMRFGFGNCISAEMENRGRKHGAGMAVADPFHQMIKGAYAPRCDYRDRDARQQRRGSAEY